MLASIKKIPWRFLPLGALFLILPFIVRLTTFKLDPDSASVMLISIHKDWFFYYKSLVFIFITVWMLFTVLFIGRKKQIDRTKPFNIYYTCGGVFILMTTLSAYLATYKTCAMVGGPTRFEGLGVIICYVMVMFYAMILIDDMKYIKWIVVCFGLLVGLQTFIGFFQYIGFDPLHWKGIRELVAPGDFAQTYYSADGKEPWFLNTAPGFMQGTLGNRNYTGSLFSLATPFFVTLTCLSPKLKQRIIFGILSLCTVFMIIASQSRAGIIGIGISLLIAIILFAKAFPTFLSWLKEVFHTHRMGTTISCGVFGLVLIAALAFFAQTGQLSRLVSDIAATLGTSKASAATSPISASPNGFDFSSGTITIQTENADTLTVTVKDRTLGFADSTQTALDFKDGPDDSYILQSAPFKGYVFQVLPETSATYIRFSYNETPVCGFKVDANGAVTPTNHWDFMPITIEKAPSIGFKNKEGVGSGRGYIWSRSFPLLRDTLLIGYGPDTFMFEFPQNDFWGKLKTYNNAFMCVDKPHNTYLQIWINQGFIALLAFLGIMLTYILHCFKLYGFKKYYTSHDALGIAFFLAIIGYLGASFFNDTTLSVTPLFWALLGAGIAYNGLYKKRV